MIMSSEEVELTQITNPQPLSLLSALPEEIIKNILARVSRWNYPALSLVCKKFRSLLSSTEIYITRSQLKTEETCVYFCLRLRDQPYWRWCSLRANPNKTLTEEGEEIVFKQDSSGNSVIPIRRPFPSPHITNQSTFTVGSEIYIIGGPSEEPSSSVWILDCRSHTWRNAPNMTVAREDACAYFDNEKIYVMGGCNIDEYSASWFEVFDMKTQSWTALPGPGADDDDDELHILLRENCYSIVNRLGEKLYVIIKQKEYTYEPKNGTWKFVREQSSFLFDSVAAAWCWIDNMVFCCTFSGDLMWCDSEDEGREWRKIKGLLELRYSEMDSKSEFVMDNYDGKLVVMWDISDIKGKNKIGYAKISLKPRCRGRKICEIWGNAECVGELALPCEAYESFNSISASV